MPDRAVYHEGSRRLQDQFDCRRIADRLEQVTCSVDLDDKDNPSFADALPAKDLRP